MSRFPGGCEYLFQARDDPEMMTWVHRLAEAAGVVERDPKKAQTLPASSSGGAEKGDKKKGGLGFLTIKKK